jgi:hypothetical protein
VIYGITADLVMILHFGFLAFVLAGAALLWRWPGVAWLHLPALVWGILVAALHWTCHLTPLDQALRLAAGEAYYTGGFFHHFVMPLLPQSQGGSGLRSAILAAVVVVNVAAYCYCLLVRKRRT